MDATELERFFFRPPAESAVVRTAQRRLSSDLFRAPRLQTDRSPYHLDLADVLPTRARAVAEAKKLVFHTVGDTGGVNGNGAQINVADHMAHQINNSTLPDQPSFLFHLGDVVYYHGQDEAYHDQFYNPYQDYPAPIFAIPGNHDGDTEDPEETLGPFLKHFCARTPSHEPEAGHSDRPTMIQPNCYWRLNTPVATIVGLYSNVSGELDNTDKGETTQRDWLVDQLRTAPADRCLIVAVHHPVYSFGKHGSTLRVRQALEFAITTSGRPPDAVLTGHDHCYQRFTLKRDGRRIPFIVAGAGGFATYSDLTKVREDTDPPPGVKLEAFDDDHPGFLRITVEADSLIGEYFTVPKAGKEKDPEKLRDSFKLDLRTHKFV
ncbi:metallophosphoesterase family protein [Paludisphaera rhizosphaerae]|uniref:metallophosphoesterase family protein n=1 Tax=Paludisphaera rhizosphaerae TaxID=2711216 RepID=UPI0013EC9757|nr:metallophosphoesterase [Paludisphaera rhizosphaerae]